MVPMAMGMDLEGDELGVVSKCIVDDLFVLLLVVSWTGGCGDIKRRRRTRRENIA